jgi:hypothetical protein
VATLIGIALMAIGRGYVATSLARAVQPPPTVLPAGEPLPANQPGDYLKVVPVRISRFGFETTEINLSSGRFMLAINTDIGDVELKFDRIGGNTVRQSVLSRDKRTLREIYDLSPGEYVLRELNHPAWSCRITVQP